MNGHRSAVSRSLIGAGLAAGLMLAGLLLWGILYPIELLDLVQALDFALSC